MSNLAISKSPNITVAKILWEQSMALNRDSQGATIHCMTDDTARFLWLNEIVEVAREVSKSNGKLFQIESKAGSHYPPFVRPKNGTAQRLATAMRGFSLLHSLEFTENFVLNPYAVIFLDGLSKTGIDAINSKTDYGKYLLEGDLNIYLTCLNEFAEFLRNQARTQAFINKRKNFERRSTENKKSLVNYSDALFCNYDKLLIVRMEFAYVKTDPHWFCDGCDHGVSGETAKHDLSQFLRSLKKNKAYSSFEHLAGYAWKLEPGTLKGAHFHCLFYFDGTYVTDTQATSNELGKLWIESSNANQGIYLCNHLPSNAIKGLGVGLVNRDDQVKRNILDNMILPYFTEAEKIFQAKINGRTFGMGAMPKNV